MSKITKIKKTIDNSSDKCVYHSARFKNTAYVECVRVADVKVAQRYLAYIKRVGDLRETVVGRDSERISRHLEVETALVEIGRRVENLNNGFNGFLSEYRNINGKC